MINLFFYFGIIHFISILFCFYLFKKLYLFDIPDLKRKIHKKPIPYSGGLSIFLTLVIIIKFYNFNDNLENIIIYSSIIIFFGLIDDKIKIKPLTKLLIIFVPVSFITLNYMSLSNLGYYENIGFISLGKFDIIFSILAVSLIINSFNYIDGIDGLALSQFFISFAYLAFLIKNSDQSMLFYLILLLVFINIFFNFSLFKKIKFFLGNSGSMLLGIILAFFSIYLYEYEKIHPSYVIWSLYLYVFEFFAVSIIRIKNKKSLFDGGNDHVHHLLFLIFNKSHLLTTIFLFFCSLLIMIFSYFLNKHFPNYISIFLFITTFLIYLKIRIYLNTNIRKITKNKF